MPESCGSETVYERTLDGIGVARTKARRASGLTNAGWRARAKDRRTGRALPREHDFSVTGLGVAVICVVAAVMFSV
jgi:hypothetical protein